jgi:hypothetical protein
VPSGWRFPPGDLRGFAAVVAKITVQLAVYPERRQKLRGR